MSRYLGPRVKVMRGFMEQIPGLSAKLIERRPYPPGQHGATRRRRPSAYALRLREKQRLRYYYGVTEPQRARVVAEAQRSARRRRRKSSSCSSGASTTSSSGRASRRRSPRRASS